MGFQHSPPSILRSLNEIPPAVKICIYGTGDGGSRFYKMLIEKRKDIQVLCFVDSFKNGRKHSLPVIRVADYKHRYDDSEHFLFIASFYYNEILSVLNKHGVNNNCWVVDYNEIARQNCKPGEVLLWGEKKDVEYYLDDFSEAKINIKAHIDSLNTGVSIPNIKSISVGEYAKRINEFRSIPIVLVDGDPANKGSFLSGIKKIIDQLENHHVQPIDVKVLHSSFLADYMAFNFKGRSLLLGYPGSGNVVLYKMLYYYVQDSKNMFWMSKKEKQFVLLSKNIYDLQIETIRKVLSGFITEELLNIGTNTIQYYGYSKDYSVKILNVRSNNWLFEDIKQTHELLSESSAQFYKDQGYEIFWAIRNPLDAIVSNAFKMNRAIVETMDTTTNYLSTGNNSIREHFGRLNLTDLKWFENIAKDLKTYLSRNITIRQKLNEIRYEEIVTCPHKVMQRIANTLGREFSEEEVGRFLKGVIKKPVSKNKYHYFRPGLGKWRQYLTSEHMEILQGHDYSSILKELGYPSILESEIRLKDIEPDFDERAYQCYMKHHGRHEPDARFANDTPEGETNLQIVRLSNGIEIETDNQEMIHIFGDKFKQYLTLTILGCLKQ